MLHYSFPLHIPLHISEEKSAKPTKPEALRRVTGRSEATWGLRLGMVGCNFRFEDGGCLRMVEATSRDRWSSCVASHRALLCNYSTLQCTHCAHCARGIPTDYGCKQCSRLAAGGKCAAPMRLPLVARWQVAEWESCDITGTQSRVNHARTRATPICVSNLFYQTNHPAFNQKSDSVSSS